MTTILPAAFRSLLFAQLVYVVVAQNAFMDQMSTNCVDGQYQCIMLPKRCDSAETCKAGLVFKKKSATEVSIRLLLKNTDSTASNLKYIAFGLSDDAEHGNPIMEKDMVYSCITTGDAAAPKTPIMWTIGMSLPETIVDNYKPASFKSMEVNGWFECSLDWPVVHPDSANNPKLLKLNANYTILLAHGSTTDTHDLKYHVKEARTQTDDWYNLAEAKKYTEAEATSKTESSVEEKETIETTTKKTEVTVTTTKKPVVTTTKKSSATWMKASLMTIVMTMFISAFSQ